MSNERYMPSVKEMVEAYATCADEYSGEDYEEAKADAQGFIAKIKADALREASGQFRGTGEVRDEIEAYLYKRADWIEEES